MATLSLFRPLSAYLREEEKRKKPYSTKSPVLQNYGSIILALSFDQHMTYLSVQDIHIIRICFQKLQEKDMHISRRLDLIKLYSNICVWKVRSTVSSSHNAIKKHIP